MGICAAAGKPLVEPKMSTGLNLPNYGYAGQFTLYKIK